MDGGDQAPDDRAVRARRGDARAYESLVEEHQAIAFRTAYLITGSAADAEEAAQEAFVRAWLALRRFRQGAEFRPWLLAIVANEARNRVRNRRRREGLAERAAHELTWQAPAADAAALSDGRLREALAALPERDRSVIACRFVLDLGEQETAAVLGIARGTVKSRTARALDRLRGSAGGGGMTLERDLRALADGFPETPGLAPRVLARGARAASGDAGGGASRCSRSRCSCSCRPPPWRSRAICAIACSRRSACATSRSRPSRGSRGSAPRRVACSSARGSPWRRRAGT